MFPISKSVVGGKAGDATVIALGEVADLSHRTSPNKQNGSGLHNRRRINTTGPSLEDALLSRSVIYAIYQYEYGSRLEWPGWSFSMIE